MAITIDGTGTIGGITAGGLPNGIITGNDLATGAVTGEKLGTKTFVSYAAICDQKASGTAGGTFTNSAWRTRDLNTEITDSDNIVSILNNQFTLIAGSYLIKWRAPAYRCGRHQSLLYDITAGAIAGMGQSTLSDSGVDGDVNESYGNLRVTFNSSNTYQIRHRCAVTEGTYGLGYPCSMALEHYTNVEIYKEA